MNPYKVGPPFTIAFSWGSHNSNHYGLWYANNELVIGAFVNQLITRGAHIVYYHGAYKLSYNLYLAPPWFTKSLSNSRKLPLIVDLPIKNVDVP